ncbi:hypothetical protein Nepgr_033239 [Nepenthes gracilis]|uniref:Uncharacterized protein n=1 Tax=Nepenthes gracilis TaxID=150966 RepID=A0AAD3Y8V8_NEPGR|nr:hypothetical protein Nepgr_033239 [Nepenthes gracilis]
MVKSSPARKCLPIDFLKTDFYGANICSKENRIRRSAHCRNTGKCHNKARLQHRAVQVQPSRTFPTSAQPNSSGAIAIALLAITQSLPPENITTVAQRPSQNP